MWLFTWFLLATTREYLWVARIILYSLEKLNMSNLLESSGELLATQRFGIYTGEYMAQRFTHQCKQGFSYIFYIFQCWNFLEKCFFCRRFHGSEGPLQKNFLQIKVEEDLKFLLAQVTLKYYKKRRETAAVPRAFAQWAPIDHPPPDNCILQGNRNHKVFFIFFQ